MITSYIIYFNTLTKNLKVEQLFIILLSFIFMLIISMFIAKLQQKNF